MAIKKLTKQDRLREREQIANELLAFRQKYLYTQQKMAEQLDISRRSLQYAEAGAQLLGMDTRRRFLELKKQYSRGKGLVA